MRLLLSLALLVFITASWVERPKAHTGAADPAAAAMAFMQALPLADQQRAGLAFDDPQRTAFRWTPGRRAGVPLSSLTPEAREELSHLLNLVLSQQGAVTVDAILATEAALGVIEGRPSYRDPERYYTAIFGRPGSERWGLRFEGHHLSINLTFEGTRAISGTPLFLGANPETIGDGPDAGLRAMARQVDRAWDLYDSLSVEQQTKARQVRSGFQGFLTRPGSLRAPATRDAGAGLAWQDLTPPQRDALIAVAVSYIEILGDRLSVPAIAVLVEEEAPYLRFHWSGADNRGGAYYYRINGRRLFIEHNAQNGGTHIHAIWRDAAGDWGGGGEIPAE
ncbi:MAG: DUF3500 domain-containing protein [Pseudomonadota bacterium]